MSYIALSDNAARQAIDAHTVFEEHARVQRASRQYAGGMYWKRQGEHEYLVKTAPDNRQERVGPRSCETERAYEAFTTRKRELEARLKTLRETLRETERVNKALKVGRVPSLVVRVLQALDDAQLCERFTVIGTHALYAYEAAAGVRIAANAPAAPDADLLWDARCRVRFMSETHRLDTSLLEVLQKADPSFVRKSPQSDTAVNARGFEVDLLRRLPQYASPHPFRFTDNENDVWPVQAPRAAVLTEAPRFEHVVVCATGRMARMTTIAPRAFVDFKRWMAEAAPSRLALKRRRDRLQGDIVQQLLDAKLLLA